MRFSTLLLCLPLATWACRETTGQRVVLHTQLKTDLDASASFSTGLGWKVTLDEALISTGALYYFDGEPAFTQAKPTSVLQTMWAALSPVQVAYAHPGHYVAGNAKGQVLLPYSADLMQGPLALPDGDGTSGSFQSATFSFAAPSAGPAKEALAGHAVHLTGRAEKAGVTVHFQADLDLADVAATAKDAQITGCVFDAAEVEHDGTVSVTIKPHVWFNLVDFNEVAPGNATSPTPLVPDSTARIALALGLGQLSAYSFDYSTP